METQPNGQLVDDLSRELSNPKTPFPSTNWDVGGWKNGAYSTTKIELFGGLYLNDGWNCYQPGSVL